MIRGILVGAIYHKTAEISITALDNSASVTLMSTDVQRIVDGIQKIHEVWASFLEIGIGTWLLQRQLGLACIIPVIIAGCKLKLLPKRNGSLLGSISMRRRHNYGIKNCRAKATALDGGHTKEGW
jgi:hypothetical protein